MGIIGLGHVQVAAPIESESDARGFYGDLLGLPELGSDRRLLARDPGTRRFYTADPWGNRIELLARIPLARALEGCRSG
jgi:hypothetical protein